LTGGPQDTIGEIRQVRRAGVARTSAAMSWSSWSRDGSGGRSRRIGCTGL
jgi:hypothetical protein